MAKKLFTGSRVDDAPVAELLAFYRKSRQKLIKEFDSLNTDFKKSRQIALVTFVNREMKNLGVKTQTWIDKYVPQAYRTGMKSAVGGLNSLADKNLLPDNAVKIGAKFTLPNKRAVTSMIDDASKSFADSMTLVGKNVRSITTKAFQEQVKQQLAQGGPLEGKTRQQIVSDLKETLKSRGLEALKDKGGKTWTLDNYAEMLARTKLAEARNTGLGNKMLENNQDLVQVSINGSSHPACAEWEGQVLSVSGNTPGYPTVDEANNSGLFHPNCLHTINPVEPDLAKETYGWDTATQSYKQGLDEE